jgi:hypothetical protein
MVLFGGPSLAGVGQLQKRQNDLQVLPATAAFCRWPTEMSSHGDPLPASTGFVASG